MAARMIEHRGVVQRIENGRAWVAISTSACHACGQGSHCGVGKLAEGRVATLLSVPVSGELRAGDFVNVGLPESALTLPALLGYLFPAFSMLLGAWLGAEFDGSDGATALGAMAGFAAALLLARLAIGFSPALAPAPRLLSPRAAGTSSPGADSLSALPGAMQ